MAPPPSGNESHTWFVARHDDVRRVLASPHTGNVAARANSVLAQPGFLLALDAPEHRGPWNHRQRHRLGTLLLLQHPDQHGAHYCLGHQLARMELAVVFPALLRTFPQLALAKQPDPEQFRGNGPVNGVRHLEPTW